MSRDCYRQRPHTTDCRRRIHRQSVSRHAGDTASAVRPWRGSRSHNDCGSRESRSDLRSSETARVAKDHASEPGHSGTEPDNSHRIAVSAARLRHRSKWQPSIERPHPQQERPRAQRIRLDKRVHADRQERLWHRAHDTSEPIQTRGERMSDER